MSDAIFHNGVRGYLDDLALLGLEVDVGEGPAAVLKRMHAEARRREFPIVGPEVGRLFSQIAALRGAQRILELGSGFGYSALWWSIGAPHAAVHLTEFKDENIRLALTYAADAGMDEQWHCHTGEALETAAVLPGPWDIIFCDIDKKDYPRALQFAEKALRPGDLLIFDNMLWHGKVALPPDDQDDATRAVVDTTRRLYESARWRPSMLSVRDGVVVAIRR